MKHILTLTAALILSACTQPDDSRRVLESAGYTNVQTGGYDLMNCSQDDTFKTRFTAVGPNGKPVSGVVCAGLFFKGSTIRID